MARREIFADDLDGKEGTEEDPVLTWQFGLGPRNQFKVYTVDLRQSNYEKLEKALAPFLAHGLEVEAPARSQAVSKAPRATRGTGVPAGTKAPVTLGGHTAEYVREWLRSNDFAALVKGQGRLSTDAISRYNDGTDNKDDQYIGAKAAVEQGVKAAD